MYPFSSCRVNFGSLSDWDRDYCTLSQLILRGKNASARHDMPPASATDDSATCPCLPCETDDEWFILGTIS